MAKNKDIFGVQRDKTKVATPPAPQNTPDTGDETVGARMRPTKTISQLKKKIKKNNMFGFASEYGEELIGNELSKRLQQPEKVEAPKEMPENQVEAPEQKLKKEEE